MKYLFLLLTFFAAQMLSAQIVFKAPEPQKYKASQVIDPETGISRYDNYNPILEGDSVRHDKSGYACKDWVEDLYESGKLLHKGYYVDGKLKIYKNYFENGQLERNFRFNNFSESQMTVYYQDGKIRSDITFDGKEAIKTAEYLPDGKPEFLEEYKKGSLLYRRIYREDGSPESLTESIEGKKNTYTKKEFHENGKVKEEGNVKYFKQLQDLSRDGKWKMYDANGKLIGEQEWVNGQLTEEKSY